jgi:hypothetical protein
LITWKAFKVMSAYFTLTIFVLFLLKIFMRTSFMFSCFWVLNGMLSFQPGATIFGLNEQHMTSPVQRQIPPNFLHRCLRFYMLKQEKTCALISSKFYFSEKNIAIGLWWEIWATEYIPHILQKVWAPYYSSVLLADYCLLKLLHHPPHTDLHHCTW